ncbi:phage tail assembly chaperone [Burkholderia multivorans]|uniref:XkdW family protein n=1 Tax=Burkholderia multivorans TaxID=87883 RepID=UPI00075AEB68|nr:phage tail assembly chaperone [Burkholderia multivorans]KVT46720.1 hypothetical protein WK52_00185 [Burkholderia multivorans]
MQFTHDHMIFTLMSMYPHLSHWTHYKVAHPTNAAGEQIGDPWIVEWTAEDAKPPFDWIMDHFEQHRDEICAALARYYRDERLRFSDQFAYLPPDATDAVREKNKQWLEYRAALRDIPSQEGFPHDIVWPTPPL